ncbi:MAG: hypothetical protein E4G90_11190, partial [Gemmatimonadales bacterium]
MSAEEIERLKGVVAHHKWKAADAERRKDHWKREHAKALEGLRLSEINANGLGRALNNVCRAVGLSVEAAMHLADGPPELTEEEIQFAKKL